MKNIHKVPGAYVWMDDGSIGIITNQAVKEGYVVINNVLFAKKKDIQLVKIGDKVVFSEFSLQHLPERCKSWGIQTITGFTLTYCIHTDKQASEYDATSYIHFEKFVPKT